MLVPVGALVAVLSQRDERLSGTNALVRISAIALPVGAGSERCIPRQNVPAQTTAVRVYVGTFGRRGGPISISIRSGGQQVSSGRIQGGYGDNAQLRVRLAPVRRDVYGTVCLRNLGSQPLQFAGNRTPRGGPTPAAPEVIRFDWLLADRPSWWAVSPKVAGRFAVVKPTFVGSWTFWAVFGALAVLWAYAIALLVRQLAR